jgi:hypothetical protein
MNSTMNFSADIDTTRARDLGLPIRPLRESVADTWEWQRAHDRRGSEHWPVAASRL